MATADTGFQSRLDPLYKLFFPSFTSVLLLIDVAAQFVLMWLALVETKHQRYENCCRALSVYVDLVIDLIQVTTQIVNAVVVCKNKKNRNKNKNKNNPKDYTTPTPRLNPLTFWLALL